MVTSCKPLLNLTETFGKFLVRSFVLYYIPLTKLITFKNQFLSKFVKFFFSSSFPPLILIFFCIIGKIFLVLNTFADKPVCRRGFAICRGKPLCRRFPQIRRGVAALTWIKLKRRNLKFLGGSPGRTPSSKSACLWVMQGRVVVAGTTGEVARARAMLEELLGRHI